jgi:hypothetical protein
MLCTKEDIPFLLSFDFSKYTCPVDNVVFKHFVKLHLGVDLIINNRCASALFEVIFPGSTNRVTFKVMVEEGVGVQIPGRSHVDITSTADREYYKSNDGVHPSSDYGALA